MNKPSIFGAWLAGLCLVALAALAFLSPLSTWPHARQAAFLAAIVLAILELAALGLCIRGRAAGVIIDDRNCMSLSKLQAAAWTVLVLSALLVAAAFNLATGHANALAIVIPPELLAAMGLSAATLAATPALLSLKTGQTPSDGAVATAAGQLGTADPGAVPHTGSVITNTSLSDADWTDMLTGDEVGNFASPDLGKIQQFLVTLLLLGVYGVLLVHAFAGVGAIPRLPPLDQSFVWLLGVSQASYLAYKAAPHTT